jgi:hypothetical protein
MSDLAPRWRWPWTQLIRAVAWAVHESQMAAIVRELARDLEEARMRPPAALPDPFVCVLVMGDTAEGPKMLGMSGRARGGGIGGASRLELDNCLALANVSVMVFCDLERVNITAIRLGKDVVTAGPGSCPGATFAKWDPGLRLLVDVQRSEGGR